MKFPTATLSLLMITSIAVALPERFSSISPDPPSASLHQELQKGKNDPSYISSHQLLENTKQAIDQTNNMGLSHNNANPEIRGTLWLRRIMAYWLVMGNHL